jgi:hypothetical protein
LLNGIKGHPSTIERNTNNIQGQRRRIVKHYIDSTLRKLERTLQTSLAVVMGFPATERHKQRSRPGWKGNGHGLTIPP